MSKMQIFEPAMCCSTGLCGVGVDPELLRISTTLNNIEKNGVKVDRFNLNNSPMEFVNNKVVTNFLAENDVSKLPIVLVDNEIVIIGRYPTADEFCKYLDIPKDILSVKKIAPKISGKVKKTKGCNCDGGCC